MVFKDKTSLEEYVYENKGELERSVISDNGINMVVCSYPNALVWDGRLSKNRPAENIAYFTLRLSHDNKELLNQMPRSAYSHYIQLFSFRLHEYVYIKTHQGRKIQPVSILFQPTFNLSNANTVLIAFDANEILTDDYIDFIIDDFGLKTGRAKFTFNGDVIHYSTKVSIL